jgi:hypothetical protein
MVDSEEKRKLIAHYRDPLAERWLVARSVAGLLIVTSIAVVGAIYAEPDEINNAGVRATPDVARVRAKPDSAKAGAQQEDARGRANPDTAKVSEKRVATGR